MDRTKGKQVRLAANATQPEWLCRWGGCRRLITSAVFIAWPRIKRALPTLSERVVFNVTLTAEKTIIGVAVYVCRECAEHVWSTYYPDEASVSNVLRAHREAARGG